MLWQRLRDGYARLDARYHPEPRRPYEYPINRYYAHRLDTLLTWAADRLGFSPNQATALSAAAGLAAAGALAAHWFVAAAVLLQLHHLLDGVDGNLARYHQCCSTIGHRLDQLSDQLVRFVLFVVLVVVAHVPAWLGLAMLATLYLDLALVAWVITPCARRYPLVRSRWKKWFMDRGLMPGFDIFTLYALVSLCLLLHAPVLAVVLVTLLKTLDWSYRLWECARSWLASQSKGSAPS
ncbi:CDP-alcohol phosphatidyltransferase family protein [Thiorhodovibrio frisius]|uniref:Phosphatidylglycerophosphate synthase n=1 Tax=Thiorhodovibrio frisius TaxID=631362 RepID=H8YYL0_9GAMM|nr:CDP-alcohol phosphatidyltransferase family protein [Thiorhodovibrio frisius]EIC23536.1 phosphatidylglycerophosphate synthase [Thiorhodovibrio frisius]WPL23377.1 CDP-diacylglycerol-serine O-phosphatidyltransferase [Thiorhodovibrio frisius]